MQARVAILLLSLTACGIKEPPSGFGVPDVTPYGLVDTDDDGDGDVLLEDWCPEPILDNPVRWYKASCNLTLAAGISCEYRFYPREDGEIPLCFNGVKEHLNLRWACRYGMLDILEAEPWVFSGADDRLVTIEWLDSTPAGEQVIVEDARTGDREEGILLHSACN